ncbi:unnamed protein product [Pieris brassicae]|uniref:Uncharacterized protein n=1 Tax=Pieris brassicae TaxID=7116 RepID=A0A9P0SZB0_PIEBR|nr:unnamed protein product [Pieris brassicae]
MQKCGPTDVAFYAFIKSLFHHNLPLIVQQMAQSELALGSGSGNFPRGVAQRHVSVNREYYDTCKIRPVLADFSVDIEYYLRGECPSNILPCMQCLYTRKYKFD